MGHPDFDTLLRYVSEAGPADECVRIEAHLAECGACLEQVRLLDSLCETLDTPREDWSLAQLKAEFQAVDWTQVRPARRSDAALGSSSAVAPAGSGAARETEVPGSRKSRDKRQDFPDRWRQVVAWWVAGREWWAEPRNLFFGLSGRAVWAGFALAAVLLGGLLVVYQFRGADVVLVQVADANGVVELTTRGNLRLPQGQSLPRLWRDRTQQLLSAGTVAPVSFVTVISEQLRVDFARLASVGPATNRPVLLTPVATSILEAHPTFRWRGVAGATDYRVIVALGAKIVWEADSVRGTELALPVDELTLPRGEVYTWQVEATVNEELRVSEPARFHLLATDTASEVERLKQLFGHSATVMTTVCLTYGLFDEAQTRIEKLRELNPENAAVARMWQELRSRRLSP